MTTNAISPGDGTEDLGDKRATPGTESVLLDELTRTISRDSARQMTSALVRAGSGAFMLEPAATQIRMPGPVDPAPSPMEEVADDPGAMINYRSIVLARKDGRILHGELWVVLPAAARRTLQDIVLFGPKRQGGVRTEELLSALEEGASVIAGCVISRLSAFLGAVVHQAPSRTAVGTSAGALASRWRQQFGVGPMITLRFKIGARDQALSEFSVVFEIQGLEMLAELARPPVNARVLLVDDNDFTRNLLARAIGGSGMEVECAATGGAAVASYLARRRDLVLLDVVLPDRPGPQVLQEILAIDPKAKVLMVSADEQDSLVRSCLRLGARGYITKPVSPARLISEVRRLLVEP